MRTPSYSVCVVGGNADMHAIAVRTERKRGSKYVHVSTVLRAVFAVMRFEVVAITHHAMVTHAILTFWAAALEAPFGAFRVELHSRDKSGKRPRADSVWIHGRKAQNRNGCTRFEAAP